MNRWTAPWWRTALLALLLFGGLGSAYAAQGPDTVTRTEDAAIPWPETLTFAEPRAGDAYEYTWYRVDADGNRTEAGGFDYALGAPLDLPDRVGEARTYVPFETSGGYGNDGLGGAWKGVQTDFEFYDPGEHRVAGRFLEGPSNDGLPGCSGNTDCGDQVESYKRQVRHHDRDRHGRDPCGLHHALQGSTIDPHDWNGTLLSPCTWVRDGSPTFRVTGLGVDDRTLFLSSSEPDGLQTVAIDPEVPVPVLFRFTTRSNQTQEAVLTGYQRGDGPTLASLEAPAPTLPLAPASPTGPDEVGIDHPFPLSRAWEEAMERTAVADWMEAHPGAYLRYAWVGSDQDDGTNTTAWHTAWSDGRQSVLVNVTLTDRPEPEPTLLEPEPESLDSVAVDIVGRDADGDPRPEQVPDRMPTVATLWSHWADATEGTVEPGYWHVAVFCTDDACDDVRTQFGAGALFSYRHRTGGERPPVVLGGVNDPEPATEEAGSVEDRWLVQLDSQGVPVWARFDRDVTGIHGGPGPVGGTSAPMAAPATPRSEAVPLTVTTESWSWPDPAVAATVTGLTALVLALHHFWPAFARLFSRVHGDAALEHPVRRRIVDALAAEPGLHVRALAARTGEARGTVTHHLRTLERTGHVRVHAGGGHRCYTLPGALDHGVAAASPLLRSDGVRRILHALQDAPASGTSALARTVGLTPSTCHHHVARLEGAGLVSAQRGRGRPGAIALTEAGRAAVAGGLAGGQQTRVAEG